MAATREAKEFREDVKKAHVNGRLGPNEVAFAQLPGSPPGTCSRLKRWLYGMRQAASA